MTFNIPAIAIIWQASVLIIPLTKNLNYWNLESKPLLRETVKEWFWLSNVTKATENRLAGNLLMSVYYTKEGAHILAMEKVVEEYRSKYIVGLLAINNQNASTVL